MTKCVFPSTAVAVDETNIELLGDQSFLRKATENTKAIYQAIIDHVVCRTGPVIQLMEFDDTDEVRLVIGYR